MTCDLAFLDEALKEWRKLDNGDARAIQGQACRARAEPEIPSAHLHGAKERTKIKLRHAGYRLVYQVKDRKLLVLVVAVGKRERNEVYQAAERRKTDSRPIAASAARSARAAQAAWAATLPDIEQLQNCNLRQAKGWDS